MALLDETGGKPLTGYGSGANSGSPVATPEESAAMLVAVAQTLMADVKSMCLLADGGYDPEGGFCRALMTESWSMRNQANIMASSSAWGRAIAQATSDGLSIGFKVANRYGGTCVIGAIQGAVLTSAGGATIVVGAFAGCGVNVAAKWAQTKPKGSRSTRQGLYSRSAPLQSAFAKRSQRRRVSKAVSPRTKRSPSCIGGARS
jgi:hypothetical protein